MLEILALLVVAACAAAGVIYLLRGIGKALKSAKSARSQVD